MSEHRTDGDHPSDQRGDGGAISHADWLDERASGDGGRRRRRSRRSGADADWSHAGGPPPDEGEGADAQRVIVVPPGHVPPWHEEDYYEYYDWDTLPGRSSWWTRFAIVVVLVALVLGAAFFFTNRWVQRQLAPPGGPGQELVITIPQGATTNDIARILADENVVANPTVFRYYLRWKDAGDFQAGQYLLQENMAVWDVKDTLLAGPAPSETRLVTIPEGLTLEEIQRRLLDQLPEFSVVELEEAVNSGRVRSVYQPVFSTLEGVLFPETYQVDEKNAGDEAALLQRMADQFDAVAAELGLDDSVARVGLEPYEVIIVASMIEREASVDEDRPKIARVIYNRLADGEPLGIDATLSYFTGRRDITASDLALDTQYNTRIFPGLPPTPIASPGRASLEAALNPAEGNWKFYVRTDEFGPGTHSFYDTFEEFETIGVPLCIERDLGCTLPDTPATDDGGDN